MAEPLANDLLPEDSYDAGDPFDIRLTVLEHAIKSYLVDESSNRDFRRRSLMNLLDKISDESLAFIDRLTEARAQLKGR
jgi:hypothetical protein